MPASASERSEKPRLVSFPFVPSTAYHRGFPRGHVALLVVTIEVPTMARPAPTEMSVTFAVVSVGLPASERPGDSDGTSSSRSRSGRRQGWHRRRRGRRPRRRSPSGRCRRHGWRAGSCRCRAGFDPCVLESGPATLYGVRLDVAAGFHWLKSWRQLTLPPPSVTI